MHADVVILGSGFGGCLTALILDRIGLRPAVIDRAKHPRFAIGESSTPIADLVLRDLAERYDLPRLKPLCRYGIWCETYPAIARGRKRGFSYFRHEQGEPFVADAKHGNELLVTASASDFESDTHWFRTDVDAFFADEVRAAGIALLEGADIQHIAAERPWRITVRQNDELSQITAPFVIDGTGEAGLLPRALGIANGGGGLRTRSRALYAHFRNVDRWEDELRSQGAAIGDHPFPCDSAALHHTFDDGWMWQLRFDNGVTSAGFVFDEAERSLDETLSPEEEWADQLARLPSVAKQFADAVLLDPPGRLIRTGRLQRRAERTAGANWALLPYTAGFVDPLHSTGIAHTLCGIERLAAILERHWQRESLAAELDRYAATVQRELQLIDRLVAACYGALPCFRLFAACTMLYFAAATTYERRRMEGDVPPPAFLLADDVRFVELAQRFQERIAALRTFDEHAVQQLEADLRSAIEPYNTAGLCDPAAANMYRYTAAVKQ